MSLTVLPASPAAAENEVTENAGTTVVGEGSESDVSKAIASLYQRGGLVRPSLYICRGEVDDTVLLDADEYDT